MCIYILTVSTTSSTFNQFWSLRVAPLWCTRVSGIGCLTGSWWIGYPSGARVKRLLLSIRWWIKVLRKILNPRSDKTPGFIFKVITCLVHFSSKINREDSNCIYIYDVLFFFFLSNELKGRDLLRNKKINY